MQSTKVWRDNAREPGFQAVALFDEPIGTLHERGPVRECGDILKVNLPQRCSAVQAEG